MTREELIEELKDYINTKTTMHTHRDGQSRWYKAVPVEHRFLKALLTELQKGGADQRAVPSSELTRELFAAAVTVKLFNGDEARLATILDQAAARIDALEQEAVPLRELRRLAERFDNVTANFANDDCEVDNATNALLAHVRKMREREA